MPDRDPHLFTGPNRLGPAALPPLSYPEPGSFGALKTPPVFASATRSLSLLSGYRRYFGLVAFILIATPLVIGIFGRDEAAKVLAEGRTPGAAPSIWSDGLDLPKRIDAYLQDHIGLRQALLHAHRELSKPLFGSYKVLVGRGGRMFYLGNEMVVQSAGLVMRDQAVAQTTDLLVRMNDEL
jgi:hypothetical protein